MALVIETAGIIWYELSEWVSDKTYHPRHAFTVGKTKFLDLDHIILFLKCLSPIVVYSTKEKRLFNALGGEKQHGMSHELKFTKILKHVK